LVELGVEPFLISSSVLAVMAQRLVRVLCADCKQVYPPDESLAGRLGLTPVELRQHVIYRAVGCDKCFRTGHRGRIGIFEILRLSPHLKTLILKTHDSNQIKDAALAEGMVTLAKDGTAKALQGLTTLEEVLRVTHR
jgi:general secretion pathway protein E